MLDSPTQDGFTTSGSRINVFPLFLDFCALLCTLFWVSEAFEGELCKMAASHRLNDMRTNPKGELLGWKPNR